MRTGGAVPSGEWRELGYRAGILAFNYKASNYFVQFPYMDAMQDGWVKTYYDKVSSDYELIACSPDGDSDLCAMVVGNRSGYRGMYVQPLAEDFSTGVLRFSVDLRAPAASTGAVMLFQPLYRRNAGPTLMLADWKTPVYLELSTSADGKSNVYHMPGGGKYTALKTGLDITHWYRYDFSMDIDSRTYDLTVTDLGAAHPTAATTGTVVATVTGGRWRDDVTGEPISAFLLYGYSILSAGTSSAPVPANAACWDNIVGWWKAPGGEFVKFYENDFVTRRQRHVTGGTASHAYAGGTVADSDVFTGYAANTTAAPGTTPLFIQRNIGTDGWQRWNPASVNNGTVSVVDAGGAGGNALCLSFAGGGQFFGAAMQSLGKVWTSGRIRYTADIRTPPAFTSGWVAQALIGLHDSRTFLAAQKAQNGLTLANAGIDGGATGAAPYGAFPAVSGAQFAAETWYRVKLTVDLDAKTRHIAIYTLGTDTGTASRPDGALVSETTLEGFEWPDGQDVGVITCQAYGPSAAGYAGAVLFDNLSVAEAVGTPQEKIVYENDFSTRTWYGTIERRTLDNGIDHPGEDGWVRRHYGSANAFLAGTDPSFRVNSAGCDAKSCLDHAWLVQDLGADVTDGASLLRFRADLRPPLVWHQSSGWNVTLDIAQSGEVAFGGGKFAQGAHGGYFADGARIRFGCRGPCGNGKTGTGMDALGYSVTTKLYVRSGTSSTILQTENVDPTHWYRFVARTVAGRGTYDLTIYDMGTEHPTPDTPTPAQSAYAFTDVAFTGDGTTAMTAVGLAGCDVEPVRPLEADDQTALLIDNVVVEKGGGMMLLVR